jgi:simple sugar transport system permease protein
MPAGAELLEASVRTATPLALAALGETVVERSGVINIGLEGVVLAGAFGGLLAASAVGVGAGAASGVGGALAIGFLGAAAAGVALAAVFALFAVSLRADQIVTGTAINLLALGLTGALYRGLYGPTGAALSLPTTGTTRIPWLADIPVVGQALFDQPAPTYLVYLAAPLIWWWLTRTHAGLGLRAVGERPEAARVAGIRVARVRWLALLFGGALGGLSGGTLVLAQTGTFAEGMSAGRGFIAIAIVVLGRWHPLGALAAAFVFGAASALQYVLQAMGWALPYQLFLALPYVLTLLALAGLAGRRATTPAGLGRGE